MAIVNNIMAQCKIIIRTGVMFFLLIIPAITSGQVNGSEIDNYFQEIKTGKNPAMPKEILENGNGLNLLDELEIYCADTASSTRLNAYFLIQQVGIQAWQLPVRQKSVELLVIACSDPDTGNGGSAMKYLEGFRKGDFNQSAKDKLKVLLTQRSSHFTRIMRLTGFVELMDMMEYIRLYAQPGNNQNERWAAIVSLARMGDPVAIQDMSERIKKLKITDDVIYAISPDLIYTRQKAALDYLVEILKSNEKNCTSANPNSDEKIACGYRIMEMLAPAIEGYPLELDESGDIKTNDYSEALAMVRAWFESNKNYDINRDTF